MDSKFPTHIGAFLGLNPGANIAFQSTGESEFVSILMDGNQSVYPLVKDSTPSADSIKDPQLLDLPPIQALGIGKGSSSSWLNWLCRFVVCCGWVDLF